MMNKTSIRFFENIPVRAVWDEESSKWLFCAMDIAEALTKSTNPRSYWNAMKRRKSELSTICRQLKLKAKTRKIGKPKVSQLRRKVSHFDGNADDFKLAQNDSAKP